MKTDNTDLTFTDEQVQQAMKEVINEKRNYLYEIELVTGGWVYTDNAEVTDEKITYTSANGIVVSVNRDEVKTMKRVKVDN